MQLEHPALRAWLELRPEEVVPQRLDVLQIEDAVKVEDLAEGPARARVNANEESRRTIIYRLLLVGRAGSAVIAKRCRQSTALIERTIYEEILPNLPLPILHYYGCVEELNGEFCWLFLEDLSGDEKYQPHLSEHRVAAARWLGIMNRSTSGLVEHLGSETDQALKAAASRLPQRGPDHYLSLLRSARDTILSNLVNPALRADDLALLKTIVAHCNYLSGHWSQLASICEGMPQTLVHGDFIKKNVGVRTSQDGLIFLPFDWEKAGWGVPAEDISRVDIPTYWSTVQDHWPKLSIDTIERLANVGKLFRCLVFLDWLAPGLEYEAVEQPMNGLRRCETWVADLIRTTKGPVKKGMEGLG
jgi:hypothetical protein